ncbi:ABC transporter substrate-binding protein [Lederbergia wuyishanensis]|uniref:MarR-like DNA-binding transcriptional regulator SgrR of sgrS sRNA n=1 Tax=Lederbergia wuyishanensis TaxID=1347903 RepID=A0ABU0D3V5_9BACI|nr:ABC transporter substrate-binding protein [Lederbergia wuyishanensis]MCJ8007776.1 ABC transporter substrate-binding protein [Lederbergia wuyishanensis]MDQ0343061.1 MarR-like DNA-binding transcriptional regulator SgrR of sgrS sRNA [Lederbergia wuyishanensis]
MLANDFIVLWKSFSNTKDHEPYPVTMEKLSELWFCTTRNAKLIVTKMVESGWIEFVPGRGRGKRSTLTFLKTLEDILFEKSVQLVKQGELKEALEQIQLYGEGTNVKIRIMAWLSEYFGYDVEDNDNNRIEILRFPIFRPITTLDPACLYYELDAQIISQIYNTLIDYDRYSKQLKGVLAHYWESNKDQTKWVFYLRKGVHFHHGKEFTSEDIVYTFGRLRDSPHKWLVQQIKEMIIHNKYTIQFNLNSPNYLFLNYLAYTPMSILPLDMSNEDFPLCPNGTGPFKVIKNTSKNSILEANSTYFLGRPQLDRIEISRIPNDEKIMNLEGQNFERLIVNHDEGANYTDNSWNVQEEIYAGSSVLTMNLAKNGPQNNYYFRKAVHRLIDRSKMVSALGEPRLYPSNGFHLRGIPSIRDREYNPSEVGPLLQKSGYAGESIHLYCYERHEPDAYWLRDECLKHGINLEVNIVNWDEMAQIELIKSADCILFEVLLGDKEISQIQDYQYSNGFLRTHLDEELAEKIDQKIDEVLQEPDASLRENKLLEIEYILKEHYAILFLVHKKLGTASHPSVQGVHMNSRGWIDFKDIWFKPEGVKAALSE